MEGVFWVSDRLSVSEMGQRRTSRPRFEVRLSIKVLGFHESDVLIFRGGAYKDVSGDRLVVHDLDNIADADIFPCRHFPMRQAHSTPKAARTSPGEGAARSSPPGEKRERSPQQPSAAQQSLQKVVPTGATPRRREKKAGDKDKEADIVARLKQICTDADPTKLYRNLVKIGAGCVFVRFGVRVRGC